MKKALLIDDEEYCTETLQFELKRSGFDIMIVGKCNDARKAKELIERLAPDIVFLDIEMPWLSGFDVLDQLQSIDFHLVFVTAFDQFALKAFDYFAINYLLKPVNRIKLKETLEKIFSHDLPDQPNMVEIIGLLEKSRANREMIALPVNNGYELYQQKEIIRCEADSNYCTIYLESGHKILISKSLKVIQELLDQRFFRVHQSHLINIHFLKKYDKSDGGAAILNDGSSIPISRLKKAEFAKFISAI